MTQNTPSMTQQIIDHYNRYDEDKRLKNDIGPFEFVRTQELMLRYLPPAPARIVDAGGATGVYSFWLAGLGYQVHLVDVVPRHIAQTTQKSQQPGSPQLASMRVGDARRMDFADGYADAIIMHGPLYHLADRYDRLRVIEEAWRVLRPGGVLLAFAITRYAGLIYGLVKGHVFNPEYQRMITHEVQTGRRENPPEGVFTLPNAYFHHPDELRTELVEGRFRCEGVLGILGPAWQVPDLDASWQDAVQRETLLALARLTENEPVLGPRLLAVGYKPA